MSKKTTALVIKQNFVPVSIVTREQAEEYAERINTFVEESSLSARMAKGQLYNKIEKGGKKGFCDSVGWKAPTVERYSLFLNEIEGLSDISRDASKIDQLFVPWYYIHRQKEMYYSKKQRIVLMSKIINEDLSPEEYKKIINTRIKRVDKIEDKKAKKLLDEIEKEENPKTTKKQRKEKKAKRLKEMQDEAKQKFSSSVPRTETKEMTLSEAYEIMECHPYTERVLNTVYKMLSKIHHPDKNDGENKNMTQLNEAKTLIMENITK